MVNNKDKVKFEDIILTESKHNVLPLTDDIVENLKPLIEQAIKDYNAGPIYSCRVNEFGNHMEKVLMNTDTRFSKPTKSNGKKQSTGYPDIRFDDGIVVVYTEVKVFNQGSDSMDMRSFYLSTFDKITNDAVHVVVGFEHVDKRLTGTYHIIDMKNKTLAVKIEFACSNKELYK